MLVVADTTTLHYLVLIDEIDLLQALFTRVAVPEAVREESIHASAPEELRRWATQLPSWVDLVAATQSDATLPKGLGAGENAAIRLALQTPESILLTDDLAARRTSLQLGVQYLSTLRILRLGSEAGWLNFANTLARLRRTNFRVTQKVIDQLLAEP